MPSSFFELRGRELLDSLASSGQRKPFYQLQSPMGPTVRIEGVGEVIVLCSNNYLGLANHPDVVAASIEGLAKYGAGTASVRFICGTFACHRELEETIARFVGAPSALTYVSCWNANEAVFPTLTAPGDVILSDELNHASIIDSCRLVNKQVRRDVYRHSDLEDLESKLRAADGNGCRWVVTDGVFSMEGDVAKLPELVELCERYEAMLVVDDSHGVGVLGDTGRGTPEHFAQFGRIDVLTGTLGKAWRRGRRLRGGFRYGDRTAGATIAAVLFSNALPCSVACGARTAIELVDREPRHLQRLRENTRRIRDGLRSLGFDCHESPTAIIPIMIGDGAEAVAKSRRLMELGVMVIGFSFPVVPAGQARLRIQASAALEPEHIDRVLDAFAKL